MGAVKGIELAFEMHCVHCGESMWNHGTKTVGVERNDGIMHWLIEPCECTAKIKDALLREALESMLNLSPRTEKERGGCFGDGGQDCVCTACKIRREIGN